MKANQASPRYTTMSFRRWKSGAQVSRIKKSLHARPGDFERMETGKGKMKTLRKLRGFA